MSGVESEDDLADLPAPPLQMKRAKGDWYAPVFQRKAGRGLMGLCQFSIRLLSLFLCLDRDARSDLSARLGAAVPRVHSKISFPIDYDVPPYWAKW